jgi:hypothetical protein
VHEQAPDVVESLRREPAFLEDRAPLEGRDTAGDDAERLTGGVVVNGLDRA